MENIAELLASINDEAETGAGETQEQKPTETQEKQETQEQGETADDDSGETDKSKQGESEESEEGETQDPEDSEAQKKDEPKQESRANKRIRELNEAKKLAESKAAQLEAQLRDIELRKQEIDKLAEGEMPDPSKFSTMQEYINALAEAKVQAALKLNEQSRLKAEQERAETAYVQEIVGSFEQKVQIAAQSNPDLPKAVEHLNKLASHIPVEVRQALLTDENAAQLAWEIATNQELLDYVCKQNPVNSIKVLAKISAKYDVDEAPAKTATTASNAPVAFKAGGNTAKPKIPAVPKTGAGSKNVDNLSPAEYYRQYVKGKIDKKPWE
jgi:flagellar biosynthesis GTPase FlhF